MKPLRIAALVKQVPTVEDMQLGPDGRLQRDGVELSMNPYCLRAVSKGVELAELTGGHCTVISMGPPAAEDVVRWGVAMGAREGILLSDPAFAGSDTLATAKALAEVVQLNGPYDLILVGKNAVDADTGQVGPQLAELLGHPFASAVRTLTYDPSGMVHVGCEHDDVWLEAEIELPAVLSTAERLCRAKKVTPEDKANVPAAKVRFMTAADLTRASRGQAGSPTWVGETKVLDVKRDRRMLQGSIETQVEEAIGILVERQALAETAFASAGQVAEPMQKPDTPLLVLMEPERPGSARELLGVASQLSQSMHAYVIGMRVAGGVETAPEELYAWGLDHLCELHHVTTAEAVSTYVSDWCDLYQPVCILAPSTSWGREVASRVAARIQSGLTGDAIDLEVQDGQLIGWKPAFGGRLIAAIRASSPIQMATVRPGVLPKLTPRGYQTPTMEKQYIELASRMRVMSWKKNDRLDDLTAASRVVGVGHAIAPDQYQALDPLLELLKAELATTRKVTDQGWLPHARQVGITGLSLSCPLYIALALSGHIYHTCGIQAAGTVLAVNTDPNALIFEHADIGIVADWADCVPHLVQGLQAVLA